MIADTLTLRQRMTWLAHCYKALAYQHHKEMRPVFSPFVPHDGVVIDVGAHAGQFTKLFSAMVPGGQVLAFEPASYALSILRRVVAVRRLHNVDIIPCALGAEEAALTLNVPVKSSGSLGFGLSFIGDATTSSRTLRSETIRVRRLDDVVTERGLRRIDFIKADIEGFEASLLAGARETLARFRPVLFLEIVDEHLRRAGSSPGALCSLLRDLSYRPRRPGGDPVAWEEITDGDYFLLPKEGNA